MSSSFYPERIHAVNQVRSYPSRPLVFVSNSFKDDDYDNDDNVDNDDNDDDDDNNNDDDDDD